MKHSLINGISKFISQQKFIQFLSKHSEREIKCEDESWLRGFYQVGETSAVARRTFEPD
jgi:hypothetical protein